MLNVLVANGQSLPILGIAPVRVQTPVGHFFDMVLIFQAEKSVRHDVLLGVNILKNADPDLAQQTLTFSREKVKNHRESSEKLNAKPKRYLTIRLDNSEIQGLESAEMMSTNTIYTVRSKQKVNSVAEA